MVRYKFLLLLLCCIFTIMAKSMNNAIPTLNKRLGSQIFDFSYFGDVLDLPLSLRQYDSNLIILPTLGQKKSLNINLELEHVSLNDINDAINNQTNSQASIIYDSRKNTLRLSFSSILDVGQDAVNESLKWQNKITPKPVLGFDGVVRFPYGQYQPVIVCQPLNLWDIELQANEDIQGVVIGDSARWNEGDQTIPIVYSGTTNLTPHLVLKPSQGGLETTLMVTTSKRSYMLKLKSAFNGYLAKVGFYYPNEILQKVEADKIKQQEVKNESSLVVNPILKMPLIDLSKVNYSYVIDGDNYLWKPNIVFDDGISVYIQMPLEVNSRSLPGLCVMVDGNNSSQCEMVNFRYNERFYIVDKLFNQAKLINGFGKNVETITIKRKGKPNFWSRLLGNS